MGRLLPALKRSGSARCAKMAVRGILIYCADCHCSHSMAIGADQRPDDVRLADLEPWFIYKACGKRGANVRLKRSCRTSNGWLLATRA